MVSREGLYADVTTSPLYDVYMEYFMQINTEYELYKQSLVPKFVYDEKFGK